MLPIRVWYNYYCHSAESDLFLILDGMDLRRELYEFLKWYEALDSPGEAETSNQKYCIERYLRKKEGMPSLIAIQKVQLN